MISTIAAKLGAFAIAPLMFFGGNGQMPADISARADAGKIAQANAQVRVNDNASNWARAELICTDLERTIYYGQRDRNTDGEVSELQAFLRAEGHLKSQVSGFFGFSTLRAVRDFQSDHDIRASGIVDAATRAEIEAVSCDASVEDLSIIGIDAPTALMAGEEGTWTVDVESESEGNLRYSVVWGDEGAQRMMLASEDAAQSSASFTHTYEDAGTYTPEFTVTDEEGRTVTKAAATVTVSVEADVHIGALSTTSGQVDDSVTITGTGFTDDSVVYVGGTLATDVTVNSDTSITFRIPSMGIGSYDVYVENENGTSNAIRFEVKAEEAVRISISSIDAPVRLSVNEEGTWTVNADTNVSGNLRYSVVWGDEGLMRAMLGTSAQTQTSSTFTHRYSEEGTYKPTFTISDGAGHSSKVSATVVVTE